MAVGTNSTILSSETETVSEAEISPPTVLMAFTADGEMQPGDYTNSKMARFLLTRFELQSFNLLWNLAVASE